MKVWKRTGWDFTKVGEGFVKETVNGQVPAPEHIQQPGDRLFEPWHSAK
jgi:hypothetical protein